MVSSHRGGSHWWNAAGLESVDNPTTQDGESRGSFAENKTVPPPDSRKLAASSENELSASLQALPIGEKGWITLRDAWHLFSQMDEEEAFGEMDDPGKTRLAEFAAYPVHRSEINFMPTEGRVYFTRK
jgi:hypothetical protein